MAMEVIQACSSLCPRQVVHDKFHVSMSLGEAVDKVRGQVNKQLLKEGDDTLKGTRQLWSYAMENLPKDKSTAFLSFQKEDLQTGRAWSIKENFRHFCKCKSIDDAEVYFRSCSAFSLYLDNPAVFDRWWG
jgi:transposase